MSNPALTTADVAALRALCFSLLGDVPASERKPMLQRVAKMRRVDDLRQLRGALFDTLARCHGEAVASARLAPLDDGLG